MKRQKVVKPAMAAVQEAEKFLPMVMAHAAAVKPRLQFLIAGHHALHRPGNPLQKQKPVQAGAAHQEEEVLPMEEKAPARYYYETRLLFTDAFLFFNSIKIFLWEKITKVNLQAVIKKKVQELNP